MTIALWEWQRPLYHVVQINKDPINGNAFRITDILWGKSTSAIVPNN